MRNDETLSAIALHEAAHFCVARALGLGATIEVAIWQEPSGKVAGHHKFESTQMDMLLMAEKRGTPPARLFSSRANPELIQQYHENKKAWARSRVMHALAGGAAEKEFGIGDGTFSEGDYRDAKRFARCAVYEHEVRTFMDQCFRDVQQLIAGPLRFAVVVAAKRLEASRRMNAEQAEALWAEVSQLPVSDVLPASWGKK